MKKQVAVKPNAVVVDQASRVIAALDPLTDEMSRDVSKLMTIHLESVSNGRRTIETMRTQVEQAKEAFSDARTRLGAMVDAAAQMGIAFNYPEIAAFDVEPYNDIIASERLEILYKRHGELGEAIARTLNVLGNEYRARSLAVERAQGDLERTTREYRGELIKLQTAVGTGKAILQMNGLPIPKSNLGRPKKRARSTSPALAPVDVTHFPSSGSAPKPVSDAANDSAPLSHG